MDFETIKTVFNEVIGPFVFIAIYLVVGLEVWRTMRADDPGPEY